MKKIYALLQRYGFKIIEDASHAIGGRYQGEAIGNSHYSDITIFSFHPVKSITSTVSYRPMGKEQNLIVFRRSLYVVEDVKAGGKLTEQNVRAIRPGYG